MKTACAVVAVILAALPAYGAEARWCSIAGRAPSDRFDYPPIARAARLGGVVLSIVVYTPNGKVLKVENISGPRLLSDFLQRQISGWTLKTNAQGSEDCQTLVIAHYRMHDGRFSSTEERREPERPSILQLYVDAEPFMLDTNVSDRVALRSRDVQEHAGIRNDGR
jgi:hypothetical protein